MSKEKAKQVVKKTLENIGKPGKRAGSISAAMRSVGYSYSYSKNPQAFTATKTYQECVKEYLPDELITKRHNELANASEINHYIFPNLSDRPVKKGKHVGIKIQKNELTNGEIKEIVESVPGCRLIYVKRDWVGAIAFYSQPDSKSRKDAIDMAYKLKGYYAPEKIQLVRRKYQDLTDKDLAELEKTLKKFLLKK
jgi:hypothetical protein